MECKGIPGVFLMDGFAMNMIRGRGGAAFSAAVKQLEKDARAALSAGPFSVTFKTEIPPSGDSHDYMSLGTYWWPDAASPSGRPYVRRDGEENPDGKSGAFDRLSLIRMSEAVRILALALFFTGKNEYGTHAAALLEAWFVSPDTRMNPRLDYAQAIPGRTEGRGIGIIDTAPWVYLVDSAGILERSGHLNASAATELRLWFGSYLDWLSSDPKGLDEQGQLNNHGTWYDVQAALFALFAGRPGKAREMILGKTLNRVGSQIAPDGKQPAEISRTRSWYYSVFNLKAFFFSARLAEHVGFDLWNYTAENGASLRGALDFLLRFALAEQKWPYREIGGVRPSMIAEEILPLAASRYGGGEYADACRRLEPGVMNHFGRLIFPDFFLRGGLDDPGAPPKRQNC